MAAHPLTELVDVAEKFLHVVTRNCAVSPQGHDTKCQCEPHQESRRVAAELAAVINKIKGAWRGRRERGPMRKIPTLFVRDPDDRKHVLPVVSDGCEWALAGEGVATRKYDGTCVRIVHTWYDGPQVGVEVRREVKPGKDVPDDFVPEQHDEVTGKTVGWVPYLTSSFAPFIEEALGDDLAADRWPEGTYELCGPKINGNPEGYNRHRLIRHADAQVIPLAYPLDYEGLRHRLTTDWPFEGIVWHHPDGRMAKLKRRDFA